MFALVDCNNFYASCERVFQPRLDGRPVVVLSNNDGCVIARSNESKALGIEMGDPWHLNRQRFEAAGVAVFSSNYTLYGDMSRRVQVALGLFAQDMEAYSIDESFLRFTGEVEWGDLGRSIRRTVRRHTGIPVSVGFGPTKVLAKLANRTGKKRPEHAGVFTVPPPGPERDAWLASFAVRDVWGIGGKLSARLEAAGVKTARDLAALDDATARRLMTVVGARIVAELRGVSCLAIEEVAPDKKAMCGAKSFGAPIEDLDQLREPLAVYASRLAEKLRAQGSVCGHLRVFLETNPFMPAEPQCNLALGRDLLTPSNFTPDLCATAATLLERIYRPGYRFKKVGVMALEIAPEGAGQLGFDAPEPAELERRRRLMAAMDSINRQHGRGAVRVASTGDKSPAWQMRAALCSPHYTTRWSDIPEVAA